MKIGSLEVEGNVFLAPMAGITDTPFRRVVQRFGVSALWTEMISAHGVAGGRGTFRTMDLEGHSAPTVFQIYGKDPAVMAEAARIVQERGAAAVDLNMGCPARQIVSKGSGAALMKDPSLVGKIVAAVRKVLGVPLTVKIRSGWDEKTQNAVDLARVIEMEGADALILHSRCRSKMHSGPVSLQVIREVKQTVSIPVIGNGGILDVGDAEAMMDGTGCDGVMIGRGALGRPWLPGRVLGLTGNDSNRGVRPVTVFDVIWDHFRYQLQWWDALTGVRRMRKHLGWYSKGFPNGAEFRQRVFREEDPERVMHSVREFFGEALIDEI